MHIDKKLFQVQNAKKQIVARALQLLMLLLSLLLLNYSKYFGYRSNKFFGDEVISTMVAKKVIDAKFKFGGLDTFGYEGKKY